MSTTEKAPTWREVKADLRRYARFLFGFVALLWVVEVVSWLLPIVDAFGVHPRTTVGLLGIFFHPFLHVGVGHVLSNSIGLLVFGAMIVLRRERDLYLTMLASALLGGLGVWLFGRSANHIGASGVVFGLFGYLLTVGFFERKLGSILLSLFVVFTWGSLLFGALPTAAGVSWEGHLFGLLAGVGSAKLLAAPPKAQHD